MTPLSKRAEACFKGCVLTNFCSCDCHKSMSIPGSVVEAVTEALRSVRREALEEAAKRLDQCKDLDGVKHYFGNECDCAESAEAIRELIDKELS